MSVTQTRTRKADFPGLLTDDGKPWHYLDTAASSQKPQTVIDAMALMDERDVVLLLVGDGPARGRLEQRAQESGVGDRVVFDAGVFTNR